MKNSRRFARTGVLLVLVGLMTAALSGAASGGATKSGKGYDPVLAQKLKDNARGSVTLSTKSATQHAGFIKAGQNGDLLPGNSGAAKGKAKKFLAEYGALLGAGSESSLEEISSSTDALGATHITYQQSYKGVPVWAGTIRAHVDARGNLTAVNGIAVPDISIDTSAKLSAAEAAARAIATVVADPPTDEEGAKAQISASDLHAASTKLYVYRLGLPKGAEGSNQLVYEVTVTNDANVRDVVFVHAQVGKIVNRYSAGTDALDRKLYESSPSSDPIWEEGNAFPGTLNDDQQNLVTFSGNSYWHFQNAFGRDSFDGLGAIMRTVNNDPTINCPNANWNGSTTNYCNGVTSDDVVAHEWGHAYTQYTHDLIYQWQPGALNESYSDIWGETVDLINGAGTDTPGANRTTGVCSSHTTPLPTLAINAPASIAGDCKAGGAAFGPALTEAGTSGNVALANDNTGVSTSDACEALTNPAQIAGRVALVDRGNCGFVLKVKNAQNAGAIAVVVANNVSGVPFTMGGADPTITIPSLMISIDHGNLIKGQLSPGPVNVTLKVGGSVTEDSYRWLMGEDSSAFGGAIRDMWSPTCLSDPGKVSDAEYHCNTSDGGGVHTNSGVPNHGYALLVDGGMYNGQTVTALGLTKAAAIYWRAQSWYQTKTTDFEDHANALDASCSDLIGKPINNLSTTPGSSTVSSDVISTGDCTSVTAMIAAVELRKDPTLQCKFTPLLGQNPPTSCATQKNAVLLYQEDFENGLTGWTTTNTGVYAGWAPPTDWVADSTLPGGRSGTAGYAENRDGQCGNPSGDRSGVMRLQSPAIRVPDSGIDSAGMVLAFDHYVATEFSYDGGNVKISINGGPYQIVPRSAFIFNGYNTTMATAAGGNTNPLAGQDGFSGTDGGQVSGTWGQSQVDVMKLGVKKGDTISLRFDFGMDGCGSVDGWYVDNIKLTSCNTHKKFAMVASPTFATVGKND